MRLPRSSPDADFCVRVLEAGLATGQPDILNTDQGARFTAEAREQLRGYVLFYNAERPHQALGCRPPIHTFRA